MRAFRLTDYESHPKLEQIQTPDPGPGEVRLSVAACGLNFADLLMMRGQYQEKVTPPYTLGMEIAGTVDAVGPDVTAWHVGDRVASVLRGRAGLPTNALGDSVHAKTYVRMRHTPMPFRQMLPNLRLSLPAVAGMAGQRGSGARRRDRAPICSRTKRWSMLGPPGRWAGLRVDSG